MTGDQAVHQLTVAFIRYKSKMRLFAQDRLGLMDLIQVAKDGVKFTTGMSYKTGLQSFVRWGARRGLGIKELFPAEKFTLALWQMHVCQTVTYKTARNYRFGVRHFHVRFDHPVEAFYDPFFKVVCQGLRRQSRKPARVQRRLPLTFPAVLMLVQGCDLLNRDQFLFATVILFGFFTGARPSEHVVRRVDGKMVHDVLRWSDLKFTNEWGRKGKVVVTFRSSKTDVDHVGSKARMYQNDTKACPVKMLIGWRHLCEKRGEANLDDPVFTFDGAPLSYGQHHKGLARAARRCPSLNVGDYTLYSLRRGMATTLYLLKATGKFIQACGRWRSDAYKVYIEKSDTELARWSDKIAATGDLSLFGALTETGSLEMSMASMGDKPTYRGPAWV